MLEIKRAGSESIPVIQSLANTTWAVTYREILSPEQMNYMLDMIYSADALRDQIENQKHEFIIIYYEEKPVGFASYGIKDKSNKNVYRLHKIYVEPSQQGTGSGKTLLNYVLFDITARGAKSLELNVNRQNNALGFYQKMGFQIRESKDIPIGNGYFMNDYILRLDLKKTSA